MNLLKIDKEIEQFKAKIIKTLNLQQIEGANITKQKILCNWISEQLQKLKKNKQQPKGILNNKFISGMMQKIIKSDESARQIESDIKNLSECIRKQFIPKNFVLESKNVPNQISTIINEIKGKKWDEYYGEVRGPLLENMFILKKQHFHSVVEQVKVNGLKLIIIQEKVAHRYQRNLIQQIFGRVFRSKGSLSMVIKLQVNHDPLDVPFNIFCYIEDRQMIDEDNTKRSMSDLQINRNKLTISIKANDVEINEINMLQIFLSQILVLPVQSLVSEFIIKTKICEQSDDKQTVQIIKCNQQDQQQIVKQTSLREHPSLRNPLLYFSCYIREHMIPIPDAKKISISRQLYSCFYRCLEIVIKLMLTDFDTVSQQIQINSSICFNVQVFHSLWTIFHRIALLSSWMGEVIQPVKKTITISQIISHFCPIFNQISSCNMVQNYNTYRDFYNNVQMESYIGSKVTKKSLEKYKDIFLNQSQVTNTKKYSNQTQIYNQIFGPVLHQANLQYLDTIESAYILFFCCKYKFSYHPLSTDIEPKWKEPTIWEKCVKSLMEQAKSSGDLPFLDIGFDVLAYVCGVDAYKLDNRCFQRVKHFEEQDKYINGIGWFVDFIRQKYLKSSEIILSSLLQKALKHKKFKTCRKLLQKRVRIRNFNQIISYQQIMSEMDQESREALIKTIQEDSPQMHRLFKWQQLMLVTLQKQEQNSVPIQTLDFGVLHMPKQILQDHIKNGRVFNNLSRKDYKFNSNRQIALVHHQYSNGKVANFYIQGTKYPLIPYFYKAFFSKTDIPQIMPYFTSFFYENKLYHIVQYIDDSLNYFRGLSTFKQEELNALTDENLIGQAIILSIILLPSQIESKDIIICPTKAEHDQIFLIDWHSYYCKDFMHKYLGKVTLNPKNSLFLLQCMNKSIHSKVISKYSSLQIQKISESVIQQCKILNNKVNEFKNRHYKEDDIFQLNNQLMALIFQQGFLFTISERMHIIKRAFSKKQGLFEKGLSYFRLMELINEEASFYYQEVFHTFPTLLEREKILQQDNFKRPFLQNSLIQFFGAFQRLQQKDNVFPLHYDRFCFEGPTQNLIDAGTNMKKLQAFKTGSIPENLSDFQNNIFEYYMKNCDLTEVDLQKKEEFLQIIKSKSREYLESKEKRVEPLSFICIKSMEFMKQKNLVTSFSFERVSQLVIQSCKLGDHQLNYFPKSIQNIMFLYLRDIKGLKYIGESALYGKPIQIRHLKTLSLIQCEDLISIDLKCDILQNLQLRSNKSLETVNLQSLNLKSMCLYNLPVLNFSNIAIYIIKGINVLACRTSCHGDLMKLYAQDYERYVANVMRYIIVRFFQDNDSRYYMLLTLLKMKEVDESLFTMAGISNFKAVSTVFNKFSVDVEDKILVQLLKLYMSNPYRKRVCINDLLQQSIINYNQIQSSSAPITVQRITRLVNQALNKCPPSAAKSISEIKFENTRLFFTNLNNSNIKILVDRLKLQRNLTIGFENLKQQMISNQGEDKAVISRQIDTIRYISVQKQEIQKVSLSFKNSEIRYTFLQRIFKDVQSMQQIIKNEQETNEKTAFKRNKSNQYLRQSLKYQNQKYIKISNIIFQNCTLISDQLADEKPKQAPKQSREKEKGSQKIQELQVPDEITLQAICKDKISFNSVRNLKIQSCILEDFHILEHFQFLTTLNLGKCYLKSKDKKKEQTKSQVTDSKTMKNIQKYKNLFKILVKLQIHTLQLQNFFTVVNTTREWVEFFDDFCTVLKKMAKLTKLKLNKNYFTVKNMKKLENVLNSTKIQQLQLNQIVFSFDHKVTNPSIKQQDEVESIQAFETLFQQCSALKSLSIQISSPEVVQKLVSSLSKNQHLKQLKLNSSSQLPSLVLKPLNNNHTLELISSNRQLPVWLLNHVRQNGKNVRKSLIKKQSIQQQEQADDPLNSTLAFGSSNSIKNDGDFFKLGLSMDGGGVRGMLLATQLNYLATRVGYPLHKIFDCIGGTSIGGILALASTGTLDGQNPVANTEQLMLLFSKYGKDIFKKSQIMQLRNLFDTKYSAQSFEGLLKNYFKDSRLSSCLSQTNVIVTAVNRVDNKDYIFKSMQSLLNRDRDFYMRDVARATSAAPTYFPSAEIKNVNASLKLSLVDGGVGLNNPSKLVIDQVKKISANSGLPNNYFLLSLGTGKLPSEVIPEYAGLKDLSPIIDSFTQSAAYFIERDLASNYKGHFFRVSPLINVKNKKDAELDNTSEPIVQMYKQTGLEAAKKYFENTVMFGKYRNMNLIQWLRQNTQRKYEY